MNSITNIPIKALLVALGIAALSACQSESQLTNMKPALTSEQHDKLLIEAKQAILTSDISRLAKLSSQIDVNRPLLITPVCWPGQWKLRIRNWLACYWKTARMLIPPRETALPQSFRPAAMAILRSLTLYWQTEQTLMMRWKTAPLHSICALVQQTAGRWKK